VFIDPIGSNGLAIDQDGLMVACTHDQRSISRIDPISGARSTVADQWMGMAFNSPNDAVVRSDGTIYFTDPNWQLGNRPQEINFEGVYRIRPAGTPELVDDGLNSPNGVALSPDETLLYVADDSNGNVWRYDVLSDGTTGTGSMFVTVPGADGMAMDCAGNLYVTSNMGVRVFDPAGSELGSIAVGDKPSNCAFGGSDRTTLFITAQDTLYSIELLVPGMP
jgi:gluconolactonase